MLEETRPGLAGPVIVLALSVASAGGEEVNDMVTRIKYKLWVLWFTKFKLRRLVSKAYSELESDYEDYAQRVIEPMDFADWCGEVTKDRPVIGDEG